MNGKEQSNLKFVKGLLKETIFFNGNGDGTKVQITHIPIANVDLTVRFKNILEKTNIKALQDLLNTSPYELLGIRNCGRKSIRDTRNEIEFFVSKHPEIFDGNYFKTQEELLKETNVPLFGKVSNDFANKLYKIKDIFLCQINLPIRIKNYLLDDTTFRTIEDLIKVDAKNLIVKKNIGRDSIEQIKEEVIKITNYDTNKINALLNDPKYILDLLDDFLEQLSQIERDICLMRWTNYGKTSLQEIGQTFNLTRERIRQILSAIIKKLRGKILPNEKLYIEYFLSLIIEKPKVISFKDIEIIPLYHRKYGRNLYLAFLSELFPEVPFEGF